MDDESLKDKLDLIESMLVVMLKNQALILEYVDAIYEHTESEYTLSGNPKIKATTDKINQLRRDMAELNYKLDVNRVKQGILSKKL